MSPFSDDRKPLKGFFETSFKYIRQWNNTSRVSISDFCLHFYCRTLILWIRMCVLVVNLESWNARWHRSCLCKNYAADVKIDLIYVYSTSMYKSYNSHVLHLIYIASILRQSVWRLVFDISVQWINAKHY